MTEATAATRPHAAFHLQVGDNQHRCSPHPGQHMFPNGHVSSVVNGFYEAMVVFSRDELAKYSKQSNPNAEAELDWEICLRATGSSQVSHRTINRVGSLPDGSVVFHIRFSDMLTPQDKAGNALSAVASYS